MQDKWTKLAKNSGMRARSYYKLVELDKKFGLIRGKDFIVDMGSAPGGWSLYVSRAAGPDTKIMAIDKLNMSPVNRVEFFMGDETTLKVILMENNYNIDLLISDMAPNTSGDIDVDASKLTNLILSVIHIAMPFMKNGGDMMFKLFDDGNSIREICNAASNNFCSTNIYKPTTCRSASKEKYIIFKDKKA